MLISEALEGASGAFARRVAGVAKWNWTGSPAVIRLEFGQFLGSQIKA